MNAPAALIDIRGLGKTYDEGTRALADVDLDVHRGEFLTLVGPSGCGKSTLLHIIAGLVEPTSGILTWRAERGGSAAARPTVGFVFQSPTLMPWARVSTNVRLPLDLAGVARGAAERAVATALERVRMTKFAGHLPRQLSGGMQMRTSIARALVVEPDVLLMDEPFGALDEFTRQRLDAELLALWSSQQMTVIFVTHSIHEAVFLSTRVVVMAAQPGRILDAWDVDAPFPRGEAFRLSPEFASHAQRLSACVAAAGSDALPDDIAA
ncbi:MAG: ABC transporter ATP-binding protein [Betaproteobacteria bacterium]